MEKPEKIWRKEEEKLPLAGPKKQETLPATPVENVTVWVNENVAMPFKLEKGVSAPIGVFLNPKPKKGEPVFNLGIVPGHFRSGLIGQVIFADKNNPKLIYRDVDVKGTGPVDDLALMNEAVLSVKAIERFDDRRIGPDSSVWGFLDMKFANYDRDKSEELVAKGLRTHRVLAIVKLKEIIDSRGEKISIFEAKRQGYLRKKDNPVVQMRAFGTRARIQDCHSDETLADAKKLVAEELGKKILSDRDYLLWFAEILGRQIAILHNNGYGHQYLTAHNITLDCRIVDLDSIFLLKPAGGDRNKRIKEMQEDLNEAGESLQLLVRFIKRLKKAKVISGGADERVDALLREWLAFDLFFRFKETLKQKMLDAYFRSLDNDWREQDKLQGKF